MVFSAVHFEDVYSLDEAARRLGITARRLSILLVNGSIAGERHGRAWLIPASEIARGVPAAVPVGRPFGQRLSWAILEGLEGRTVLRDLAREERARVREYVSRPLAELAPRLRGRARHERLIVNAAALEGVAASPRWVTGGARALRLVASSRAPALEVYLPAEEFDEFLDSTLAVPDAMYPNLVAHLVKRENWRFPAEEQTAWPSVALLDLFDSGALSATALESAMAQLRGERILPA